VQRRERYAATDAGIASTIGAIGDYAKLLQLAVDAGVDAEYLQVGSIPVESLDFVLGRIEEGPGLHIGNYAGVSLAYLAAKTDEVVVAVDPNVPHWGHAHPQDIVVRLLTAAGVQDRVLLVCGYSLEKNPSNDGSIVDGYDPAAECSNEFAPEHVLQNLRSYDMRFGWALLDGNHEPGYLRAELDELAPLIRDGGRVFLDDCDPHWPEIRDVFMTSRDGWSPEGTDGRIGVLRRIWL
jgi:hypothetical protein